VTEPPPPPTPSQRPADPWSILGGPRFAVFLLLAWALLVAVGTFLPQDRAPEEYHQMLGRWAGPVLALGLHRLYTTPWFLSVLAFLCLNLAISSVRRVRRLGREARAVKVECSSRDLARVTTPLTLPEDLTAASDRVAGALRRLRMSVRRAEVGGEVCFYAERGRLRLWGSTWAHLGLLVVFLGALVGHWRGHGHEGYLYLVEGTSQAVTRGPEGEPSGLTLRLHRFQIAGDETGRPLDYASDLELLDSEGRSLVRRTVRVNEPLEYGATSFYQAGYGMSGFRILLEGPAGRTRTWKVPTNPRGQVEGHSALLLPEGAGPAFYLGTFVPQARVQGDRVEPVSSLPLAPAAEVFENPNPYADPTGFRPLGWLVPGRTLKASDGTLLSLGPLTIFSGIQYRHDPGYPLVILGFGMALLGLAMTSYIGYRRLRVVLSPGPEGTLCYVSGIPGPPGREPADLPERLARALTGEARPEPEADHASA